jgi:hypothetical protein
VEVLFMETITIGRRNGPSIDVRISEYVTILTNPVRWEIVRLLDSEPLDIELISSMLYRKHVTQRPLSRQAIEKHIQQLTKIGVIMKRPGVRREENRGLSSLMEREGIVRTRGQNVSLYAVVPEGIETVLRSLDTLGNYRIRVELRPKVERVKGDYEEFVNGFYRMRVLNGEDAGRLFRLRNDSIRIGRIDTKAENKYDPQHDIVLSNKYAAVSRVWRPHARLIHQGNEWLIEHCEGTNGTYLDNRRLEKHEKARLEDHDVVDLVIGEGGARLVFLAPEPKQPSTK